jgi:hypothetical protein
MSWSALRGAPSVVGRWREQLVETVRLWPVSASLSGLCRGVNQKMGPHARAKTLNVVPADTNLPLRQVRLKNEVKLRGGA